MHLFFAAIRANWPQHMHGQSDDFFFFLLKINWVITDLYRIFCYFTGFRPIETWSKECSEYYWVPVRDASCWGHESEARTMFGGFKEPYLICSTCLTAKVRLYSKTWQRRNTKIVPKNKIRKFFEVIFLFVQRFRRGLRSSNFVIALQYF